LSRLVQLLRSAGFARGTLLFLGAYAGVAAWLPWAREGGAPPAWAVATGLDHPFSAIPLLLGCAALFASTLACTWGRRSRVAALRRGELPPSAPVLGCRPGVDLEAFLRSQGFRGRGPVLLRHPIALWGGWIFHVGLLVLIAAVVIQQAFHDGGAFELTEGEQATLAQPGVVFGRERGPFAPANPPEISVGLLSFDPFQHQRGYAPDRASRVVLQQSGGERVQVMLDRAAGVSLGSILVYQAIPSGLAVNLEIAGQGVRSVHLRSTDERRAAASVLDPAGRAVTLTASAEHPLDDPRGTGALTVRLEEPGHVVTLAPGVPFDFGGRPARLVSVARWSGFTYARSPGMPGIFAGFALVLAGALLIVFPAGVARLPGPGEEGGARVVGRGTDVIVRRWRGEGTPGGRIL
jgi:hypothetical protein